MNTEEINVGLNAPKLPGIARFFSVRPRKMRTKATRQVLSAVKPWQNYAGQVELPSQRWLKTAELAD